MTKRDLVARISEETGLVQGQVSDVVQKTFDGIIASLSRGEGVELRNFGVFEVRHRKPRVGRNPSDPSKEFPIPARAVVKFKPGKEMKEIVMKLVPDKDRSAGNTSTSSMAPPA
jgi:DNA-binding protein HU-beta/integration host factor subunit alpha